MPTPSDSRRKKNLRLASTRRRAAPTPDAVPAVPPPSEASSFTRPPAVASPAKPPAADHGRTASRAFWGTITVLAIATLGMMFVARTDGPTTLEITPTVFGSILGEAARGTHETLQPEIDSLLDAVYAPAYAAIPAYADFHYSVLGEYTELTQAIVGNMSDSLLDRVFAGFDTRLAAAAETLDLRFTQEYRSQLAEEMARQVDPELLVLPLGTVTETVLEDATSRLYTSVPLAGVAVAAVGSGSLKLLSAAVAGKLGAKITAKAAIKGAAKGGGALAGAGGSALACSWSGPGALICGVVGGVAAWVLTDAVVINLDEFYNRDEFEVELRAIIDEDRAVRQAAFEDLLAAKVAAMNETFRLSDPAPAD